MFFSVFSIMLSVFLKFHSFILYCFQNFVVDNDKSVIIFNVVEELY